MAAFDSIVTAPARARRRMLAGRGGLSDDVGRDLMAAITALTSKVDRVNEVVNDLRAQLSTVQKTQNAGLDDAADAEEAVDDAPRSSAPLASRSSPRLRHTSPAVGALASQRSQSRPSALRTPVFYSPSLTIVQAGARSFPRIGRHQSLPRKVRMPPFYAHSP